MGFEAKGTDDIALARIVTLVPSEGKEPSHRLPYLVMGDQRRGGRGLHLDGRAGVDAGPVTVKGDSVTKDGSTYDWLFTSFPLDRAKVVRWGGGRGLWSYRVGDTEALVTVHPSEGRSEMVPRKGDAVKFRFELFTGPEFKDGLPGATFRPTAEFVARSDQVWPWLRLATAGMAVGDRVRVEVPAEVAEGAKGWLPAGSQATVLYLEVGLVSTGQRR